MTSTLSLVDAIDTLLPQTQCTKCGFAGCRPYAEAIASDAADINQCPPGGAAGIRALAQLLRREPKPLSAQHGLEKPREVAVIDEAVCIGCTKCILACPVDAILGAAKMMHTVLAAECTGCDLCIAPCPVDCISMQPAGSVAATESEDARREKSNHWRHRFESRRTRLARDLAERTARLEARRVERDADHGKRAAILAALARAGKSGAGP